MAQCIVLLNANSAEHIGKQIDLDLSYNQLITSAVYYHFAIGSFHPAFCAVFFNYVLTLRIMHKLRQRRRFYKMDFYA